MNGRVSIIAQAIALWLTLRSVCFAQPDLSPLQRPSRPMIEAAQQHYLSGTRFFEAGSWDAALVEFTASLNPTTLCTSSRVHLWTAGVAFLGLVDEGDWAVLNLLDGL